MNDSDSLQGSFWTMILLQTMGSVDMPGGGDRKMPAPRAYLATIVIWVVLHQVADAGYGKAARVTAWVMVLAGLVFGTFAEKVTGLFSRVATAASGPQTPTSASAGLTGLGTAIGRTTRTGAPIRPKPGSSVGTTAGP